MTDYKATPARPPHMRVAYAYNVEGVPDMRRSPSSSTQMMAPHRLTFSLDADGQVSGVDILGHRRLKAGGTGEQGKVYVYGTTLPDWVNEIIESARQWQRSAGWVND